MKGKYKNRTRVKVEKGYGPRHALNAQEGSEAVPEELPTPTTPEGLGAVGRIAAQMPKAVKQAGQQIAGFGPSDYAQLALAALSGGEEEPLGVAGQVRNAVDRYDFDEQHTGPPMLADDLEGIENLPKPLTEALQQYRNAVEEDRTEWGQRSDLPERYGENLYKLATKHAAPPLEGDARGTMSVGPRHANNGFQEGTSDASGSSYNPSGFYGNVLQPQDVSAMRQQMDAPGRSSLSPIEETLAANPDAQSFYYDQTSGGYVPFGGGSGYAGGDENIKPGSINDEVPLPVQGNTEMVETPTDTSHQQQVQPLDIPPASETPEVNLDTLGLSPGQMEIINALGYDPSQNQGAGGGGMQLINELGYDPSAAYGSAGSGVPTQTGAGYGGQFVGGLLGNLLLPGIGGLVGSQLGGAGARMLTRSLQGGQVPWQTPTAQGGGQMAQGGGVTLPGDFFPGDAGGLGQPMGYFPWYSPGETGSSSYAPFTGGVGGEGGTLGNSDMSNVGAGPLPGSFAGLGSFGGGDLGSYGGGIGEHTPSFRAWIQGQGFPNVASYQAAMAGPPGPTMAMAGGGGGAPVGLQHATGGHIQTAQTGKSNVHSTDTVPAMLTPREAVLNRNAAELAGRGNIQKLNSEGNQLAEQGVDLAGEDKNMKQKYQRGAARIAPVPLTGPKPTARADLAGIMKYLPMGQLARGAASQAVMPKVGVRGYQAGTSATDPLSMYQSKLSTSPLGGGQSLGGGPGPSPFPGPSPTPNPGPGPMPVGTTPPPYGGRPVPTLGGAPSVPPRPDAGKPSDPDSTPLSFNNWAANAGAPGFTYQAPPPTPNPDGTLNATKPGAPPSPSLFPGTQSNSFFPPPNPAQRTPPPLGFQGGTIDAPQAGTQFANVQYSAPQINIAALKNHLQSQGLAPNTVTNLLKTLQGTGALGGGVNTGMTTPGGMSIVNSLGYDPSQPQGYQGGISDIGYPPMVGPNMVYHADKGSNWIGEFDPRYTFQRYWRGTGAVMPMGAGLGPVMGARPFVHPVRPVPPVRF